MPWLKLLHITAVVVWCGALLYLPPAIAAARRGAELPTPLRALRGLYTLIATPAALLAIGSGTLIFFLQGPFAPWLVAKLGLVSLLVLAHAACGALILRGEQDAGVGVSRSGAALLLAGSTAGLAGIAWLVLGKPGPHALA